LAESLIREPNHQGETVMGDKGSKDKAKREDRKKPKMTQKEKKKLKIEKKKTNTGFAQ
jgi:hypothetical protein